MDCAGVYVCIGTLYMFPVYGKPLGIDMGGIYANNSNNNNQSKARRLHEVWAWVVCGCKIEKTKKRRIDRFHFQKQQGQKLVSALKYES